MGSIYPKGYYVGYIRCKICKGKIKIYHYEGRKLITHKVYCRAANSKALRIKFGSSQNKKKI